MKKSQDYFFLIVPAHIRQISCYNRNRYDRERNRLWVDKRKEPPAPTEGPQSELDHFSDRKDSIT